MRASIYNAVPEEAIDELINFMKDFFFNKWLESSPIMIFFKL